MAGVDAPPRPAAFSSPTAQPSFSSRIILLLAALPFALACLAFVLQWRGGLEHPATRWPTDTSMFPGMEKRALGSSPSSSSLRSSSSSSDCTEILGRGSFPFNRGWNFDFDHDPRPKICITTSTSAGLEQILPWLYYHKVIGVTTFFLFVEGQAAKPDVSAVLESIPGVKVIDRTSESEMKQSKSRFWNGTQLSDFLYKSCNYGLFLKQSLNMERAIVLAQDAGMDWIIHLDTDELIHPAGAREYSLRQLLSDVPSNVDMVTFPNYESSIERDDIKDPFTEVSMFKKNYDHLPRETYFSSYKEATRGNPYYFLTYVNGKSAARIQEYLRPKGAHRWHNHMKTPNEIKLEEAAILHYTYAKFSDLASRRDRCDCKPTKDDVKRCFMLEFDREAFIIASTATEEEMLRWFRERVVWTNKQLIWRLLKKGILTRIYTPMVIIRGLRESGVFTSAVVSAKTLTKEKFLSSRESLQNKKSSAVPNLRAGVSQWISASTLRQISDGKFQANARRILELASSVHNKAIAPLA